jgi:hypothetical protein
MRALMHRALVFLVLLPACPAPTPPGSDGAVAGDGLLLSEAGLAICARPGAPCVPADPCGLSPRCGADLLCRSEGRRDCDDGIACTDDRCVRGGCENAVAVGHCLIEETCHGAGTTVGCGRCDPALSSTRWTPLSGKSCDDGNLCTRGDQCLQGLCVGQLYSCSDGLGCTLDACDGAGGCHHYLKSAACLIEQRCYQAQETDASGCSLCEPKSSTSAWTPRASVCKIDGVCHSQGAKDPTGCYECDALHLPDAWTPLAGVCRIGASCVAAGAPHASKCAHCDPAKSASYWSPKAGASLSWSSFGGWDGWTASPPSSGVGWQLASARYVSEPSSLYYGSPAQKSYDTGGAPNAGTASSPPVQLPVKQRAYLALQLWLDVESADKFDVFTVLANGKAQWVKSAATVGAADYRRWLALLLDLSAFEGQPVVIQLAFDTKDGLSNSAEGIYVDDVTLLMGCGSIL